MWCEEFRRKLNEMKLKTPSKWYTCPECSYRTLVHSKFKQHIPCHQNKPFQCNQCNFGTSKEIHLKVHSLIHTNINNYLPISDVNKINPCLAATSLSKPVKINLLLPKRLKSPNMNRTNNIEKNKDNLETSKENNVEGTLYSPQEKNVDGPMLECQNCSYKSNNRTYMQKHQLHHKIGSKKLFKCDACSFEAKKKSGLDKHKLVHTKIEDVTMFGCTQCDFKTKYKCSLRKHMERRHT